MIPISLEVSNLLTPFTNAYKAISNEWKHFFEMGVSEYLQSQTQKYYYTNTFLHRGEKVKFWDVYFPVRVKYKYLNSTLSTLANTLDEYKFITIIGTAGSGKSTLVKSLFLNSIRQNYKVPLLIELRHFNDYEGSFENFILESILITDIKPSLETLKRTIKSGKFLFLLDGYDELFITDKRENKRQIGLFSEISRFIEKYQANNFVITTRPGSGIERLPRFYDFRVCELNEDEVKSFVIKLVESQERKNRILASITDSKNSSYREYLSNPLLLSMYILAFESHPEIPSKRSAFYRNVFDTLYSKHDGITKNSFPRQRLSKIDRDDFEKILDVFSYLTLLRGEYTYTEELLTDQLINIKEKLNYGFNIEDLIYDLETSISILIKDGFEYKFPHRSIQEYFAAQFVSKLPTGKKEKAYSKLDYSLKSSSTDESFNLWSLCQELDLVAFNNYFLIPHLKKLAHKLSYEDHSLLFDAFCETFDVSLHLEAGEKIYIGFSVNFNYILIGFSQSFSLGDFGIFMGKTIVRKDLVEYYDEVLFGMIEDDSHVENINDEIKEILLNHGIIKIIEEKRNELIQRIIQLERDAITQDNVLDDILAS